MMFQLLVGTQSKTFRNPNYRAKIRQVLQRGPFRRVGRGRWERAA